MEVDASPAVTYEDIGGIDDQIREVREAVEEPLVNPEQFEEAGIEPPSGVLLYGPPGTGKTMLAKAVANETDATFIKMAGSELVQKFIGEGRETRPRPVLPRGRARTRRHLHRRNRRRGVETHRLEDLR